MQKQICFPSIFRWVWGTRRWQRWVSLISLVSGLEQNLASEDHFRQILTPWWDERQHFQKSLGQVQGLQPLYSWLELSCRLLTPVSPADECLTWLLLMPNVPIASDSRGGRWWGIVMWEEDDDRVSGEGLWRKKERGMNLVCVESWITRKRCVSHRKKMFSSFFSLLTVSDSKVMINNLELTSHWSAFSLSFHTKGWRIPRGKKLASLLSHYILSACTGTTWNWLIWVLVLKSNSSEKSQLNTHSFYLHAKNDCMRKILATKRKRNPSSRTATHKHQDPLLSVLSAGFQRNIFPDDRSLLLLLHYFIRERKQWLCFQAWPSPSSHVCGILVWHFLFLFQTRDVH